MKKIFLTLTFLALSFSTTFAQLELKKDDIKTKVESYDLELFPEEFSTGSDAVARLHLYNEKKERVATCHFYEESNVLKNQMSNYDKNTNMIESHYTYAAMELILSQLQDRYSDLVMIYNSKLGQTRFYSKRKANRISRGPVTTPRMKN